VFDGQPKEIIIYETVAGVQPLGKWMDKLRDAETIARLNERIDRLEQGNPGDYKAVGAGIYELRIDYGPGFRLYFAFAGRQIILLLCGGDKSTQARDIQRARQYWQDYQQRHKP
jgi:putative addiction module killer protein